MDYCKKCGNVFKEQEAYCTTCGARKAEPACPKEKKVPKCKWLTWFQRK